MIMKPFSVAVFGTVFFGKTALADQNTLKKQTIEPCSWWAYDFNVNGYVCRSTLPAMTVYSAKEVDKKLDDLAKVITSLEARVKILEEK